MLTVNAIDGDEKDRRPIRYAFVNSEFPPIYSLGIIGSICNILFCRSTLLNQWQSSNLNIFPLCAKKSYECIDASQKCNDKSLYKKHFLKNRSNLL